MLFRILLLLTAIFTVKALDLHLVEELSIINPNITKCIPSIEMLDASAKFTSGILKGNWLDLGNFDECLESVNKRNAIGKYCLVKLGFSNPDTKSSGSISFEQPADIELTEERMIMQTGRPIGLTLGWCVPEDCPIDQLTAALDFFIPTKSLTLQPASEATCQTKNDLTVEFNTNDILIIVFFGITLFLMVTSTIYDLYIGYYEKKPAHIILIAFSVKTNGKKLLAVSNQSSQLSCLHGIRFISMLWVLYSHKFATFTMGPLTNLFDFVDWVDKPINQYLLNATVSVDSFFLLSGVLVSYVYCLAMSKGANFNVLMYYVHRYLRLTPVLAVVVWFHTTLMMHMGSGPLWPMLSPTKKICDDYWWSTLLYIQNYYNDQGACVAQSWYLAVDMQLFILSPILLIPLWKWPKKTMAACGVLLVASIIIPFTISYVGDYSATLVGGNENQGEFMSNYYVATHCRYGVWLIGFVLGYYLFTLNKNKENKIKLSPLVVGLGWILSLGLLLTILFSAYELTSNHTLENAFFNAFHRQGWGLGLSWVIFACTQGYGGPVNTFLSWSAFQVLSRFTYTMYLSHFVIMYMMVYSSRTTPYYTDFFVMFLYWGDFMLNLAICVPLTLAFESPMVTIEKVLFGKGAKKDKKPQEVNVEEGQTNKGLEKES